MAPGRDLLARLFSSGRTNLSNSMSVIAFTTSVPVIVFLENILYMDKTPDFKDKSLRHTN